MATLVRPALPGVPHPASSSKISLDAIGQLASLSSLLKAKLKREDDASLGKALESIASLRTALLSLRGSKGSSAENDAAASSACALAFELSEHRGFAGRFEKVALLALADVLRRDKDGALFRGVGWSGGGAESELRGKERRGGRAVARGKADIQRLNSSHAQRQQQQQQ